MLHFQISNKDLLYASSYRQDNIYTTAFVTTSCGALAGMRNNSTGSPSSIVQKWNRPWYGVVTIVDTCRYINLLLLGRMFVVVEFVEVFWRVLFPLLFLWFKNYYDTCVKKE